KKATLIPNEDIPFQPIQTIYKSQGHQNLWVIDKLNGGKADSINAGIATCQTDLFAVIDADSILGTESLIRAIRPYVQFPNKIAATGGVISGINNLVIESGRVQNLFISNQFLHNIQALEYYRAFLLGRLFWQKLGATFLISGAFGTFDRESVLDVGAYSENTVGEDIEIGFKLIRRKYETSEKRDIIFVPDPVCWTEVPSSLQILSRQRSRWQQGMMETLFTHSRMLLNKKFGIYGKFAIPFLWATEILYLPIAIIGYLSIPILYIYGYFSADFFIAFICVEFILGVFTSNIAILARQAEQNTILDPLDIMIFVCTSIIENFGYRQLCTFWRFLGAFKFITGNKSWGEMTRSGI
ncbi:MAG: cellulose synthase/poly-beta-1,6-N-acetylglucosamine synthase-like glycosyltransferase, partial [Candidatus Marinamargulisbacteria bacterium]